MHDDKEYREALEAIDHTGSTNTVLNKLGKLAANAQDQRVRDYCDFIGHVIRETPAWRAPNNFRVLTSAGWKRHDNVYTEYEQAVKDFKKHCDQCIGSKLPQWQILAAQAGWSPPLPPLQNR